MNVAFASLALVLAVAAAPAVSAAAPPRFDEDNVSHTSEPTVSPSPAKANESRYSTGRNTLNVSLSTAPASSPSPAALSTEMPPATQAPDAVSAGTGDAAVVKRQDELVADALRRKAPLFLSLAGWIGDIPASPDTIRYRLAVAGRPGRTVDLRAEGVPKGWIASFCTRRLCEPTHARLTIPNSRRAIRDFMLVSLSGRHAALPSVRVRANDGIVTVTTST